MSNPFRWPWSWWETLRPRAWKWRWQKLIRGYSDVNVWNLFMHVTRHALPPLRQLRERHGGYVEELGEAGWDRALDDIIAAFEEIERTDGHPGSRYNDGDGFDEAAYDRTRNGLRLFGEYFLDLWD